MKGKHYLLFFLGLILTSAIFLSCDNSTGPEDEHSFPDAIDSVATDITLYVWGVGVYVKGEKSSTATDVLDPLPETILDTLEMVTEGSILIDYEDQASYYIYAKANGFYTELYYCEDGEIITVDLDAVPDVPNSITGVIFENPGFPPNRYHDSLDIVITNVSGKSIFGKTDSLGRYGFGDLSACTFVIRRFWNTANIYY